MRRLLPALLVLSGCTSEGPSEAQIDAATARAETAIAAFQMNLKGRLLAAIEEGGPAAAIGVCREAAPAAAQKTSESEGVEIGRTALRVRNPANAPTEWQRQQMLRFQQEIGDGADPAELSAHRIGETIAEDGGRTARYRMEYMKPIMTGGLCLTCHGEAVAPDIKAEIAEHYPQDQATGFRLGEMRGAFSVRLDVDG